MARLNTRTSATPAFYRASTVDSLYRDPTPVPGRRRGDEADTARQSSYSVISPARSMSSDKENHIPHDRTSMSRSMSREKLVPSRRGQRLPTPDSASSGERNGNKRRRTGDYTLGQSEIYQDEVDAGTDEEEADRGAGVPTADDEDEQEGFQYYNPDQNPKKRQFLRAGIRRVHRDIEDNRDEMMKPGDTKLEDAIKRENSFMNKVRQTADAALDSRVLVLASDLVGKRLRANLHDQSGLSVDVDQFISRAIFFMKERRPADVNESAPTQSRGRRQTQYDEDDDEDAGEGLDWAFLSRAACFPNNKRPPVPNFLLGPLSLQKRVRSTQRRARSQRQPLGPATQPQEIKQADISKSGGSNLTHLVSSIKKTLQDHINVGQSKIEQELESIDPEENGDPDDEDFSAACRRHRVYVTPNGEGAVSLFDFAVNPDSFGQTVENLFYISFLIREGNAKVLVDDDGLPLLVPETGRSLQQQREQKVEKNQAVFSIDWPIWRKLIDAFDIKKPLIPHRVPHTTSDATTSWHS